MLLGWIAALGLAVALQSSPSPSASLPSDSDLVRTIDHYALSICLSNVVGFSNVPVECVVSEDGSLHQCELRTDNRAARRLRRTFDCMASAVSFHDATGAPAVGRRVRLNFSADGLFDRSPD